MRKLKRHSSLSLKTGIIIAVFSLLVTAVFAGLLLVSRGYTARQATPNATLYALKNEDLQNMSGLVTLAPENITTAERLYRDSVAEFAERLLPPAIGFCLFLFAASLALWMLLERVQGKRMAAITQAVTALDADVSLADMPAFGAAIEQIRRQYQDNLDDYKRLNSYLSHEQKNALAILRAHVELSPDPVYLRHLDYLAAGIDDILTLAETEGEDTRGSVDVSLVCASVCDSYKKLTDAITFTFDETVSTEVSAKQRWIYRAVSNLVDNAVKYGNGRPIEVSVTAQNGSVIVRVTDHGAGIPADKQSAIFRNRYRVGEQQADGYGIGLSLVSHVCDLCGGFVYVDSESGVGSTFYLSLPQLTPA